MHMHMCQERDFLNPKFFLGLAPQICEVTGPGRARFFSVLTIGCSAVVLELK